MIDTLLSIAPSGILQGLVLSILVIGIMIPFRILNFPDLTAEGSYPLGACLSGTMIVLGASPLIALVCGAISAGIMGIGTAIVHLKYKVNTLLAGIILSTMIYSINLRIMGKPNIALFDHPTIFNNIASGINGQIIILAGINLGLILFLYLFLITEKGLQFRATGFNQDVAKKFGIRLNSNIILGLFLGNSAAGLAGGLLVQIYGYVDIGMGVGIVIHALAAMMIGEKIIGTNNTLKVLIAPFIGAIIYQQIQGIALAAGLAPSDLKLLTGAIVLAVIAVK